MRDTHFFDIDDDALELVVSFCNQIERNKIRLVNHFLCAFLDSRTSHLRLPSISSEVEVHNLSRRFSALKSVEVRVITAEMWNNLSALKTVANVRCCRLENPLKISSLSFNRMESLKSLELDTVFEGVELLISLHDATPSLKTLISHQDYPFIEYDIRSVLQLLNTNKASEEDVKLNVLKGILQNTPRLVEFRNASCMFKKYYVHACRQEEEEEGEGSSAQTKQQGEELSGSKSSPWSVLKLRVESSTDWRYSNTEPVVYKARGECKQEGRLDTILTRLEPTLTTVILDRWVSTVRDITAQDHPTITKLELKGSTEDASLIASCINLRALKLYNFSMRVLPECTVVFSRLRELTIAPLRPPFILSTILQACPMLRSLELTEANLATCINVISIGRMTGLRELRLPHTPFSTEMIALLSPMRNLELLGCRTVNVTCLLVHVPSILEVHRIDRPGQPYLRKIGQEEKKKGGRARARKKALTVSEED